MLPRDSLTEYKVGAQPISISCNFWFFEAGRNRPGLKKCLPEQVQSNSKQFQSNDFQTSAEAFGRNVRKKPFELCNRNRNEQVIKGKWVEQLPYTASEEGLSKHTHHRARRYNVSDLQNWF